MRFILHAWQEYLVCITSTVTQADFNIICIHKDIPSSSFASREVLVQENIRVDDNDHHHVNDGTCLSYRLSLSPYITSTENRVSVFAVLYFDAWGRLK